MSSLRCLDAVLTSKSPTAATATPATTATRQHPGGQSVAKVATVAVATAVDTSKFSGLDPAKPAEGSGTDARLKDRAFRSAIVAARDAAGLAEWRAPLVL